MSADSRYPIPDELRDALAVAIAYISTDGSLLAANAGFLRLLADDETGNVPRNVASAFVQPRFGDLAAPESMEGTVVHAGLFTLGSSRGGAQSLKGRISRKGQILHFFAEHAIETMDGLQQSVLELNSALAESQRMLSRAKRDVEQRLDASEIRFRALSGISTIGIFQTNGAGACLFVNEQWSRITGLSLDRALGDGWLDALHPDDAARVGAEWSLSVSNRIPFRSEYRFLRPDGELRWVLGQSGEEVDIAGRVTGHMGTVTDITERKQAEMLLAEYAERLHALPSHLEAVREQERTRVARELHDELGQLLTALKMDISLLRTGTPASEGTSARLEGMTSLADEALGTVRRIASDLRPVMLDDLGLKAAIEWFVEGFRKRYCSIVCNLVVDLDGCTIEGEIATAAYRIIQECLTNVIRHAEAGRVHIVVAVQNRQQLVISVQDNGRGLQDHQIKTAGFGLLGMRERANALGGSAAVESMPGEGVSVDVTIPLPKIEAGRITQ